MAVIVYLGLCLLVGALASNQRGGFFLYFVLSLVLSPIIGLLVLVIASPNDRDRYGAAAPPDHRLDPPR